MATTVITNYQAIASTIAALGGTSGLQFRATATHLQWKTADTEWTNLVSLAEIGGTDFSLIEWRVSTTHLQWRFDGINWVDVIALSALGVTDGITSLTPEAGKIPLAGEDGKIAPEWVRDVVTATTSPGGVVRNSLGELVWKRGHNQLVRQQPTRLLAVADRDGTQQYTSTTFASGGSAAIDMDMTDPATGLPMLKLTCPAGAAGAYQNVTWQSLSPIEMADSDLWLITVYSPVDIAGAAVRLQLYSDEAVSANYRRFTFQDSHTARLARGWNVLICRNDEIRTAASDFAPGGTTPYLAWETGGTASPGMQVRCVRVSVAMASAPAAPVDFWVGSVHRAPQGWCTAAMMWSADDVPQSFGDIAIPIIESYGWRTTLNCVSTYTDPSNPTYLSIETLRQLQARGHEIWGHARTHENLANVVNKTRAMAESSKFWRANGFPQAAQMMAWPFGAFNADALAAARSTGYKVCRAANGSGTPWLPTLNPYTYNAFSPEISNPWQADAQINGTILRGQSMLTYMHVTVPGGAGVNAYPGPSQHYADHLRRWCDLVKSHEEAGRVAVLTASEYWRACGVDPLTDPFLDTLT